MPGLLNHSVATIVGHALIDLGYGTTPPIPPASANPWPIYAPLEPDRPDNVITISNTSGRAFGRTQPDAEKQGTQGISVRIRATDPQTGAAKSWAIAIGLDRLYQQQVTVGPDSYVIHSIGRTGDPIDLGFDTPSTKLYIHTINALVSVRKVTP